MLFCVGASNDVKVIKPMLCHLLYSLNILKVNGFIIELDFLILGFFCRLKTFFKLNACLDKYFEVKFFTTRNKTTKSGKIFTLKIFRLYSINSSILVCSVLWTGLKCYRPIRLVTKCHIKLQHKLSLAENVSWGDEFLWSTVCILSPLCSILITWSFHLVMLHVFNMKCIIP